MYLKVAKSYIQIAKAAYRMGDIATAIQYRNLAEKEIIKYKEDEKDNGTICISMIEYLKEAS